MTGFPSDWKTVDHLRHHLNQAAEALASAGALTPTTAADHIRAARQLVDDQDAELHVLTRLLEDTQEKEPHW